MFKIGDRVRRTYGNNTGQVVGYVGVVTDVTEAAMSRNWLHFADGTKGLDERFELVPFQIEAGKTYRSDTGAKVGPMVRTSERHDEIYYVNKEVGRWRLDGAAFSDSRPDLGNLVAEWVEPLQIEAGKFYKTHDGEKVGPMEPYPYVSFPWAVDRGAKMYSNDGKRITGRTGDEIISEWVEPVDGPVRTVTETVTRTEIVPGVYGRVGVEGSGPHDGLANIRFTTQAGKSSGIYSFNADELEAAAGVLTALAGALRNA